MTIKFFQQELRLLSNLVIPIQQRLLRDSTN